jgi:hypothetical protein
MDLFDPSAGRRGCNGSGPAPDTVDFDRTDRELIGVDQLGG